MNIVEAIDFLWNRGIPTIPVHGVMLGECSCGRDGCPSPGKHPLHNNWQNTAPKTLEENRNIFREHKGNIGACLAGTPYVVLDFDGPDGLATLAGLSAPKTLTAKSGSGGVHLFFKVNKHQRDLSDRRVLPGLDVKKHGQVLVHPSAHASGGIYEWTDTAPIAELPDRLYQQIRNLSDEEDMIKRARHYIAKMPPSISGKNGHGSAWAVARKLTQDFHLQDEICMALMREYNEKCLPPWSDAELWHKVQSAREKARISNPVDDHPPPLTPTEAGDWRAELLWVESKNGKPKLKTCEANVIKILQHHPEWRGKIQYDEFHDCIYADKLPWHKHGLPPSLSTDWRDEDSTKLCAWLQAEFHGEGFDPKVHICEGAVETVARDWKIHPVRQYLSSIQWNGQELIKQLPAALGAKSDEYTYNVLRWWLISAVARIFRPGCKADNVLILEGKTGMGKSKALAILGGNWFSDTPLDLNSKDAYQQIRGKWIVELAELDSLTKVSHDRAKAFFSSGSDYFRAAYARRATEQKRQCVFCGTTNDEDGYLRDPTGNRRYWPIWCGEIDHGWIFANRDQLWAEAVHRYQSHELWYPETKEEFEGATEAQTARAEQDAWESRVITWARTQVGAIRTADVMEKCLRLDPQYWTTGNSRRVAAVLRRMGFERKRSSDAGRGWVFIRPPWIAAAEKPSIVSLGDSLPS